MGKETRARPGAQPILAVAPAPAAAKVGRMDYSKHRGKALAVIIPLGIGMNLVPGFAVMHIGLPVFFDMLGTVTFTLLCGWRVGASIAVLSLLVGGLFVSTMPYFLLTAFMVAVVTAVSAQRGGFRNLGGVVVTGIVMGAIAAVVSSPAVALAFGAGAKAGQSAGAAFVHETWAYLRQCFASRDAWIEPTDKTTMCVVAWLFLRSLPRAVLLRMNSPQSFLKASGFL
jgi:energy-coupling factor transport system substrate-specific component